MNPLLNKFLRLTFLFIPFLTTAQTDTSFWFAAPWVTPDHTWRDPIAFHFSSYNNTTTIRLRQPSSTYDTTFILPPNTMFTKDLSHMIDSVECKPANQILNHGFHISSDYPITAIYEEISRAPTFYNQESYSLKGNTALGTDFITPFQNIWNNQTLGSDLNGDAVITQPKSQFSICATENNTTVWIVPACNIVGHAAGVAYSIVLNAGQVYTCENVSQAESIAGQSLSGSRVTSDKPISISVSDDSVRPAGGGGCYDLMGDQIIPVNRIGTEYIVQKGFLNAGSNESVFFVGSDTLITVYADDGVAPQTITLNPYETKSISLTQNITHFSSSHPVYALHMSGFGCETGSEIIPPVFCNGNRQCGFTRNNSQTFNLLITTRSGNEGNFLLDGNNTLITAPSFTVVPGTAGQYMAAKIPFTTATLPASTAHIVSSTGDCFTLGILNGGPTTGGLYHYVSSFEIANYMLTGNVNFSGGPVNSGYAELFYDTINFQMPKIDSVPLISGTYTFNSVPEGNYIIWIHPDTNLYPTLIPTYLDTTYLWSNAQYYLINGPCGDTINNNVTMLEIPGIVGNNSISGQVFEGIGFARMQAPGSPIGGIDVGVRKKPAGTIIGSTFTDINGYYQFDSLPDDCYDIFVNIPGLPMDSTHEFCLAGGNTSGGFDFIADSAQIYISTSTEIYESENSVVNLQLYPNPNSGNFILNCSKEKIIRFDVFSIGGELIFSESSIDRNQQSVSLNNIAAGIYLIKIMTNNTVLTKPLIIRK